MWDIAAGVDEKSVDGTLCIWDFPDAGSDLVKSIWTEIRLWQKVLLLREYCETVFLVLWNHGSGYVLKKLFNILGLWYNEHKI